MNGAMTDQPITKLVEFLREEFGAKFKAYYDGDPDEIPETNLPCVVCVKLSDNMANGPSGMQRVEEELQVKVIYNKADDWTGNHEETDLTEKKIRDIVEARSASGGYDPSTIKHALMNKFQLQGVSIQGGTRFELGVLPRTEDLVTAEGHLTLTLSYLMPNTNVNIS